MRKVKKNGIWKDKVLFKVFLYDKINLYTY